MIDTGRQRSEIGRFVDAAGYNRELLNDELAKVRYEAWAEPGDDKVIPLDNAHRLLQLIQRSELHVFGRWADDFNALLKRFLSRPER